MAIECPAIEQSDYALTVMVRIGSGCGRSALHRADHMCVREFRSSSWATTTYVQHFIDNIFCPKTGQPDKV